MPESGVTPDKFIENAIECLFTLESDKDQRKNYFRFRFHFNIKEP